MNPAYVFKSCARANKIGIHPPCLYVKHGTYWLEKNGKWHHLGRDYREALQRKVKYRTVSTVKQSGMVELIDHALEVHLRNIAANTAKQYKQAA